MRSATKALTFAAAALGLALLSSPAHATLLPINSTVVPNAQANPLTTGSVIANTGVQSVSAALGGNSITGTAQSWVVTGFAGNPFGSQFDTFVYQVSLTGGTNTSNTPVILERVTGAGYDSFSTDAGYNASGSQVVPTSADRSSNGNVVGFNFISPGTNIGVGQSSALLIVNTNATSFSINSMSLQDGVAANASGYSPSAAIPEPSSAILMGGSLALLGLGAYARRRARA
jgi:hypothetical protein